MTQAYIKKREEVTTEVTSTKRKINHGKKI